MRFDSPNFAQDRISRHNPKQFDNKPVENTQQINTGSLVENSNTSREGREIAQRHLISECASRIKEPQIFNILIDNLNVPLAETGLEVRILSMLDANNIIKIEDVLRCTVDKLISMRNFGPATVASIYKALLTYLESRIDPSVTVGKF